MWQNPFNHPIFTRMSPRTKIILTAVVAFLLGMMSSRSGGTVGRYQFRPTEPMVIIDTTTGETFQYSSEDHAFKHFGSLPWH